MEFIWKFYPTKNRNEFINQLQHWHFDITNHNFTKILINSILQILEVLIPNSDRILQHIKNSWPLFLAFNRDNDNGNHPTPLSGIMTFCGSFRLTFCNTFFGFINCP